jgi:hypothetical protein
MVRVVADVALRAGSRNATPDILSHALVNWRGVGAKLVPFDGCGMQAVLGVATHLEEEAYQLLDEGPGPVGSTAPPTQLQEDDAQPTEDAEEYEGEEDDVDDEYDDDEMFML